MAFLSSYPFELIKIVLVCFDFDDQINDVAYNRLNAKCAFGIPALEMKLHTPTR